MTDIPLPDPGDTSWTDWATDEEAQSDVVAAATDAATPSTLVKRDAAGRFKAVDGTAASDVATKGQLPAAASDTVAGVIELATDAETQTGTATDRAVTPANLAARTATETRTGVVELATTAEATTGTDTTRAVTAAGLAARTPAASETASGLVELATAAETTTGTDNTRAVHPTGLKVELDKKAPLRVTTTTQTGTTYTFVLADANTLVEGNNASAITFTVPNSVFTAGDSIAVRQYGAGQITTAAGAGTTARARGGALKTAGQYAELTITFRSASEFVVTGDVTT